MEDAVAEVFERMLDRSCASTRETYNIEADIVATIKFSGALDAECILEFPSASAQKLTSAFLGPSEVDWEDSMVADTVGELCNMIAGGWKKRIGPSAWEAELSIPSISLGPDRDIFSARVTRMASVYTFDDSSFVVRLKIFQAADILPRPPSDYLPT